MVSTRQRPAVVDDFIRNFLIKHGMKRALDAFQTEWYELAEKGMLSQDDIGAVPDIYLRNQQLDDQQLLLDDDADLASFAAASSSSAAAAGSIEAFRAAW